MLLDSDLQIFLKHVDWYSYEPGKGYVPTEKAPEHAINAMISYNLKNEEFNKKYEEDPNY